MKKKLGILFFLFVVVLQLFQLNSAQIPLQMDEEDKGSKDDNWVWTKAIQADKASEMAQEALHLMGEERCEENDEECMKRRMMTESHLDYIYTQSHNKP